jgi:uncharacterized protein DUF5719
MSERRPLRARGQALAAVGTVVAVATGLLLLDRAGTPPPASARGGAAPSGAWICPHGGGSDWTVSVFLANPGPSPVAARVTALSDRSPEAPTMVEVPPAATVRVPAAADVRSSATYVEYFGGWIGVGWVATAGSAGEGLAAEPCASEASRRWFVPDGTTELHEDAYVVVTNPFAAPAVLDAAVFTPDRAPVRDSAWTDLVVKPQRSIVLHLNGKVEGEAVTAAGIEVSVGRVVAASLGVTDGTRIRSSLGSSGTATGGVLPEIGGSGQAELIVLSVTDQTIRFGATALTEELPRPAGGLTDQDHKPLSARAYPVQVGSGPTAIRPFVLDGASAVTALRVLGSREDFGATAGASSTAGTWLVFPALTGSTAEPALVLANAGDADAVATLQVLPGEGGTAAESITVDVPAHGTAAAPPAFLASAPGSAVVVHATSPIVALSAASAAGDDRRGAGGAFALSMGVPVPHTP